jgi:hypothetical protein
MQQGGRRWTVNPEAGMVILPRQAAYSIFHPTVR